MEKSSLLYQIFKRLREVQNTINIENNTIIKKNLNQFNKYVKNLLEELEQKNQFIKSLERDIKEKMPKYYSSRL